MALNFLGEKSQIDFRQLQNRFLRETWSWEVFWNTQNRRFFKFHFRGSLDWPNGSIDPGNFSGKWNRRFLYLNFSNTRNPRVLPKKSNPMKDPPQWVREFLEVSTFNTDNGLLGGQAVFFWQIRGF